MVYRNEVFKTMLITGSPFCALSYFFSDRACPASAFDRPHSLEQAIPNIGVAAMFSESDHREISVS